MVLVSLIFSTMVKGVSDVRVWGRGGCTPSEYPRNLLEQSTISCSRARGSTSHQA